MNLCHRVPAGSWLPFTAPNASPPQVAPTPTLHLSPAHPRPQSLRACFQTEAPVEAIAAPRPVQTDLPLVISTQTGPIHVVRDDLQIQQGEVVELNTLEALQWELEQAPESQLVVVEVQSQSYQQVGGEQQQVELHWRRDVKARALKQRKACLALEVAVERAAGQCQNVRFLQVKVPDEGAGRHALIQWMQLSELPAMQFYRGAELLWEQQGQPGLERALGAGVLFFTGQGGGGAVVSDVVQDLLSVQQVDTFLALGQQDDTEIKVALLCESTSGASISVFPAVVALARSFLDSQMPVRFGRVVLDDGPQELGGLVPRFNVRSAPTFVFYSGGKECRRYVGANPADLRGQVMDVLQEQVDANRAAQQELAFSTPAAVVVEAAPAGAAEAALSTSAQMAAVAASSPTEQMAAAAAATVKPSEQVTVVATATSPTEQVAALAAVAAAVASLAEHVAAMAAAAACPTEQVVGVAAAVTSLAKHVTALVAAAASPAEQAPAAVAPASATAEAAAEAVAVPVEEAAAVPVPTPVAQAATVPVPTPVAQAATVPAPAPVAAVPVPNPVAQATAAPVPVPAAQAVPTPVAQVAAVVAPAPMAQAAAVAVDSPVAQAIAAAVASLAEQAATAPGASSAA